MAITSDMKLDVSMVQPIQTTATPLVTVERKIAPQTPAIQYPGGGNQTFYDYPTGSVKTDYVQPAGVAQPLGESYSPSVNINPLARGALYESNNPYCRYIQ
ncbi:hypothetical protein SAMN04515617_12820 [Collimonas sp. OK242]|nr:hypothetical protein SAMN04515617_12820 [Collimonas sp. OK242]